MGPLRPRCGIARALALTASVLFAAAADAAVIGEMHLSMAIEGQPSWYWTSDVAGIPDGTGTGYTVADGSYDYGPGSYEVTWQQVSFDVDPRVAGVWAVTNNSGLTQNFTLSVSVPVLPVLPSSLMFGSSTISVGDAGGAAGATLATLAGFPMYAGQIDGSTALPLFGDPFSLAVPFGTNGSTQFAGAPPPGTLPGPAALLTIGIEHRFSLSPGDQATFNSVYEIVAIPEPGTAMLLVLGLGALALRRRA
jgi:hypothetical protein